MPAVDAAANPYQYYGNPYAAQPPYSGFPLDPAMRTIAGVDIPSLPFAPGDAVQALRAEYALAHHGLPFPNSGATQ